MSIGAYGITVLEFSEVFLRAQLRMQDNLDCFEGHFPGMPILPGVMQLHWVINLAKQHWYPDGKCRVIPRIKFQRPIQPDDMLEIELSRQGNHKFNYTYKSAGHVMSSGTFEFVGS